MNLQAVTSIVVRAFLPLLLTMACGSGSSSSDSDASPDPSADASPFDAGPTDDAGPNDAGPMGDAGPGPDVYNCNNAIACGTCENGLECLSGRCVEVGSVVVSSDAELTTAIADSTISNILIAPGTYTLANMATGVDRTANPLTIQGLDPADRPVFQNATQSLLLTRHVSFRNLSFLGTGNLGGVWFYDGGGNDPGDDTHDISIECSDFTGPNPGNKNNSTANPNYANSMTRLFQFSNYATHNYTLRNITAEYVFQVGDFRMNGNVILDNFEIDFWYFDGIRIIASGEEGYVEGNRLIANIDLTNNIAVYNEMGNNAPHPDNTQVFNTGSTLNNTNPSVQNVIFYRNRFNPGQYRATNVQAGLTQSPMRNVGYIENIWTTKASAHGISLEGGGRGVLIERNTIGDADWGSPSWVRIFRTNSQVIVADSYFRAGFNLSNSGGSANGPGFELVDINNEKSASYASTFNGPSTQNGIASLMTMFTPSSASTIGALNAEGQWRGGAHRPMRALAPIIVPGNGQFSVTTLNTPTLQSPNQTAVGGDIYSQIDLRWSRAGTNAWTIVTDVSESDVVPSDAGSIVVQTRCVNSAGEGLWSFTTQAAIN